MIKRVEIRQKFLAAKFHVIESNDTIQIEDQNVIDKVLRKFGSHVLKLAISFTTVPKKDVLEVIELANVHCDALIDLQLSTIRPDWMNVIRRPFYNVENVTFNGKIKELSTETMNLSEIFPKLRSLNLGNVQVENRSSVILPYPNLDHLFVAFKYSGVFHDEHIESLIKLNPQIRSLTLQLVSTKFIDFVSKNLEGLKNLELLWVPHEVTEYNQSIHFKSVERFHFRTTNCRFVPLVTFDQLKTLSIDWGLDSLPDTIIDFIIANDNLTKLSIIEGNMNNMQLLMLIGQVPHLKAASFTILPNVMIESIFAFLKNRPNLHMLELSYPRRKTKTLEIESLRKLITNEWTIMEHPSGLVINKIQIDIM